MQTNRYHLHLLSKNRDVIYGISIIWITFFHSSLEFPSVIGRLIASIKVVGNVGVDIFLLLSGISLYFSFSKDEKVIPFYRRRLHRIILPYLIVSLPYFLIRDIVLHKYGIGQFFLDLSGLSLFLSGERIIWFVIAILICYLIYPFVYRFFKQTKWKLYSVLVLIALDIAINCLLSICLPELWNNSEILFRRIPVFLLGAFGGKFVKEDREIPIPSWCVILVAVILFTAYKIVIHFFQPDRLFSRYIYIMLSIPLACTFSLIGELVQKRKILSLLSKYTLEIYLTHEKSLDFFNRVFTAVRMPGKIFLINAFAFCLSIFLSILVNRIACIIRKVPLAFSQGTQQRDR